ncbi:Na+/H+ antiporter NhaC family protein [Pseudokineococcus sp. 1T1Z-3]|uniref:Na+/H+ antiporter NhaC family protein n=1 Tax=Pseudokineococcus sp. 1T1Z-3 TaxID=3132745 RepID=UPI0030A4CB36
MLRILLEPVVSRLRSTGGVVVTTLVSGFAIVSATSTALIKCFLAGDLFGGAFARRRLHPVNLSRSMEDSATLTEVLMPWTVSDVFIATTLGVGNFEFLLWAVTDWAGVLFQALIAVLAPVTGGALASDGPTTSRRPTIARWAPSAPDAFDSTAGPAGTTRDS